MADMARRSTADLINLKFLLENASQFEFFQLLYLLEHDHRISIAKLQLTPATQLTFPAADIQRAYCGAQGQVCLQLNFLGLYGVDATLPHYFRDILNRQGEDGQALKYFLDIFNQRVYRLLYLAWKKSQVRVPLEILANPYLRYLVAISGNKLRLEEGKAFAFSGLLGCRTVTSSALTHLLSDFLTSKVNIQSFIAREVTVAQMSQLGTVALQLGNNFLLGNKILDFTSKISLELGPFSIEEVITVLPTSVRGRAMAKLISRYLGSTLEFEIIIYVARIKKPLTLGISPFMLGCFSYLGIAQTDASFKIQGKNYG